MKCKNCKGTKFVRINNKLLKCEKCGQCGTPEQFFDIHQKWTKKDDENFIKRLTEK